MILDSANLQAMQNSVRALVLSELAKAVREYQAVAMEVPSSSAAETYVWLKSIPGIRQWIGPRVLKVLETEGFSIPNRPFELTIPLDRPTLERDQFGVYRPLLAEMGQKGALFPDVMVASVIVEAITKLCFDGQYLCDTDHPVGSGTVSNKFALALTADNYGLARGYMRAFTDDEGTPLKVRPTHLYCASALEGAAKQVVATQKLAGGADNIHYKSAEVLVIDELAATRWGLMDLSRAIKPVILQTEKAWEFVSHDDPKVHQEPFYDNAIVYGIDGRFGVGPGIWQLICQCDAGF